MKLKFFTAGLIALTGASINCPEGYEAKLDRFAYICIDSDECSLGTHTCSDAEICVNIIGSYTCVCFSGKRSNFGY